MITSKQLWETIYKINQFSDFKLFQQDELILINEKEKRVIRFVTEKQNVQSLDFLIQKMKVNIVEQLQFKPDKIEVYLVNQSMPVEIRDNVYRVHAVNDSSELNKIKISRQYQLLGQRRLRHSENYFQKRLLTDNYIDRAMIKFAPMTFILLLLNILIYIFNLIASWGQNETNYIESGALSHFNFVHGEYYRIITSIFLHFDFSHLLFNMMSLYIFGKLVEYFYGSFQLLLIYMISGLMGNLLSLSFETTTFSVGASGAIMGLLGALFTYMIVSRQFNKKLLIQTGIGLIIFLLASNLFSRVNNWAHFGGLFTGFFIALMIYCFRHAIQYFYILLVGLLLIIGLMVMNIFSVKEENIYNDMALSAMKNGDFKKAEQISKDIFVKGFEDDESYQIYGLVLTHNQSLSEGIATWKQGLKSYPESPRLNYQMALAMRANDDYKAEKKYLSKASRYLDNQQTKDLKKELKVFGE